MSEPAPSAAPATAGPGAAAPADPVASYQSLYRRFRPQRFGDVLGQEHVTVPLHNAVRHGTVSHAYLFSGPRGTGKTSTARILAKALNCTDPQDGEPCGRCPSCQEIARGTSMDVHELDAASNNGVDAMRDLVSRAALGTPGRTKVYIVDEVHMLSAAASNALLKTLEEPPGHVVFVLATTDPQKVLPTIRSRTQHFEFRLLGADTLGDLLRSVSQAAQLGLDDAAVDVAVRRGRGSARDALSILDQVAAGGAVDDETDVVEELAAGLAEGDTRRTLVGVGRAMGAGFDPQRLAAELADQFRQAFLAVVAPEVTTVGEADRRRVQALAERMGLPAVVRAMERLGTAQVAMRDAPDPRVHLEVALVRLSSPDLDDSVAALVERVDRLERALAAGGLAVGAGPAAADQVDAGRGHGGAPQAPVAAADQVGPAGRSLPPSGAAETSPPSSGPVGAPPPPAPGPADADAGSPLAPSAAGTPADAPSGGPQMARRTLGALRRQAAGTGPAATGPAQGGTTAANPSATSGPAAPPTAPAATPPAAATSAGDGDPDTSAGTAPVGAGADTAPMGGPAPADGAGPVQAVGATSPPAAAASSAPTAGGSGPAPAAAGGGNLPTRDELVQAWGDVVLASLPGRARARFRMGRFVAVTDGAAVFALPNETHRSYCEDVRRDVEDALAGHFGRPVPLRLVVDDDPATGSGPTPGAAERGARPVPNEPGSPNEPDRAEPRRAEPGRTVPGRAEPGATGNGAATGAGRAEPGRPEAGHSGAGAGRAVAAGDPEQEEEEEALLDPEVLRAETAPAGAGKSAAERLKQAFPGAEEA